MPSTSYTVAYVIDRAGYCRRARLGTQSCLALSSGAGSRSRGERGSGVDSTLAFRVTPCRCYSPHHRITVTAGGDA